MGALQAHSVEGECGRRLGQLSLEILTIGAGGFISPLREREYTHWSTFHISEMEH